jgi:hypothetical protein
MTRGAARLHRRCSDRFSPGPAIGTLAFHAIPSDATIAGLPGSDNGPLLVAGRAGLYAVAKKRSAGR